MTLTVSVPTEKLAADLGPLPADVDLVVWPMDGPPPRASFDMVVPPYMELATVLARLDGVPTRLVQSQSIGYEGVEDLLPSGPMFANAATVHETSTAELAVGLAIAAELVRLHGGTIALEPSDSGAIFMVALPARRGNGH